MKTLIKVRSYHLDSFNHVNNARYLEFLEESRWEFLESLNALPYLREKKYGFALVNVNINYRIPALLDETLEINTRISHVGNKHLIIEHIISNHDLKEIIADAKVIFVITDPHSKKAVTLDESILSAFKQKPAKAT